MTSGLKRGLHEEACQDLREIDEQPFRTSGSDGTHAALKYGLILKPVNRFALVTGLKEARQRVNWQVDRSTWYIDQHSIETAL